MAVCDESLGPSPLDPPPPSVGAALAKELSLPPLDFGVVWTLVVLLVQLVVGAVFAVLAGVVLSLNGRSPEDANGIAGELGVVLIPLGTLTTLLTAFGIATLMFRRQTAVRIGWRGLPVRQLLLVLALVLPLAIVASEATNCVAQYVPTFDISGLDAFAHQNWILVFIAACVFPGVGEEVFFRGFLGRGLVARHGVVPGVLLTSLLFAVVHIEPVQATGAFVLGVAIHVVYLATRSLAAPILLHTLNNLAAFITVRYGDIVSVPGVTTTGDGEIVHTPMILFTISVVAVLLMLALLIGMRTRWVLPNGECWSPGYLSGESPPRSLGAKPVCDPAEPVIGFAAAAAFVAVVIALLSCASM